MSRHPTPPMLPIALGALAIGGLAALLGAARFAGRRRRAPKAEGAGPYPYIRSAGPLEQRDETGETWDRVDEASDESFPASDPPSTY